MAATETGVETYRNFIGGEWVDPAEGQSEEVINPATGEAIAHAPLSTAPAVDKAVAAARARTVAVSPIVAGAALKGPADRLLTELGHEASVVGVARLYAPLASVLVIDDADAHLAPAVEDAGVRAVVAPTVMHGPDEAAALALERVKKIIAAP